DHAAAAQAMDDTATRGRWMLNAEEAAWAWAQVGRSAAWRLAPEAPGHFARAQADRALAASAGELRAGQGAGASAWSADTLAWMARASLRAGAGGDRSRWALVEQAIDAMPPEMQREDAWLYWRAKALQARAQGLPAVTADLLRHQARELLRRVADPLSFYGQLAAEELTGSAARPPVPPAPLSEAELASARSIPGIDRALRMYQLGWRSEAVREWNFTLGHARPGGLGERELLAVAEEACRREIWDRCINTSDRTRREVHLGQRYPTPYREEVLAAADEVGL